MRKVSVSVDGKHIFGPFCDYAEECKNGTAIYVRIGDKWGAILKDGKFIPCEYEEIGPFFDDTAFAKKDGCWFLIDSDNIVQRSYGIIEDARPEICVLVFPNDSKWGAIDKNGNVAIPFEYDSIAQDLEKYNGPECYPLITLYKRPSFSKKYIRLADRYGRILTTKDVDQLGMSDLYRDRFTGSSRAGMVELANFGEEGDAMFNCDLEKQVCDFQSGQTVESVSYMGGNGFEGTFKTYREGKCRLIWRDGRIIASYELGCSEFGSIPLDLENEYLVAAKKNGKWGYISLEGIEKLPYKYDYASPFNKGAAVVGFLTGAPFASNVYADKYWLIDHHGRLIHKRHYCEITEYARYKGEYFVKGTMLHPQFWSNSKVLKIYDSFGNVYNDWNEVCRDGVGLEIVADGGITKMDGYFPKKYLSEAESDSTEKRSFKLREGYVFFDEERELLTKYDDDKGSCGLYKGRDHKQIFPSEMHPYRLRILDAIAVAIGNEDKPVYYIYK